jgi:hypothetical protein
LFLRITSFDQLKNKIQGGRLFYPGRNDMAQHLLPGHAADRTSTPVLLNGLFGKWEQQSQPTQ